MKKRRQPRIDERRKTRVEVNLLAEKEGGRVITKTRGGCTIPFLGAGLLVIVVEGLAHIGLG